MRALPIAALLAPLALPREPVTQIPPAISQKTPNLDVTTPLLNRVTITSWGMVLGCTTYGLASNAAATCKVTFNLRFRF